MRSTFEFLYLALLQTHNRCKRFNGDKENPKTFSADNDRDAEDVPPQLEEMAQVEQILIAKAPPIMRVYRLKGGLVVCARWSHRQHLGGSHGVHH